AVRPAVDGQVRLEALDLHRQRRDDPARQIRRIGDDHVEASAERAERSEEIAGEQPHPCSQTEAPYVLPGGGESAQGPTHRERLEIRARRGERAGDGATARADVGYDRARTIGE